MSEEPVSASRSGDQSVERAEALGEALTELLEDPEAFVAALRDGLDALHDAEAGTTVPSGEPGADAAMLVRGPLLAAMQQPIRRALAEGSAASALWLVQRLSREEALSVRLFAVPCLERCLPDDPERTWQLLRQLGRRAGDPIEVDALADPFAQGILSEGFRWAELEQLAYSDHVAERRLVGASLARLPRQVPSQRHERSSQDLGARAFSLIGQLIGDHEPVVQEALSWAIRAWTPLAAEAAAAFLRDQAAIAVERRDGHRAWVIREALAAQPPASADELRRRLEGIERDPDAPATSAAAERAATFAAALPGADAAVGQQGQRYTRSGA